MCGDWADGGRKWPTCAELGSVTERFSRLLTPSSCTTRAFPFRNRGRARTTRAFSFRNRGRARTTRAFPFRQGRPPLTTRAFPFRHGLRCRTTRVFPFQWGRTARTGRGSPFQRRAAPRTSRQLLREVGDLPLGARRIPHEPAIPVPGCTQPRTSRRLAGGRVPYGLAFLAPAVRSTVAQSHPTEPAEGPIHYNRCRTAL